MPKGVYDRSKKKTKARKIVTRKVSGRPRKIHKRKMATPLNMRPDPVLEWEGDGMSQAILSRVTELMPLTGAASRVEAVTTSMATQVARLEREMAVLLKATKNILQVHRAALLDSWRQHFIARVRQGEESVDENYESFAMLLRESLTILGLNKEDMLNAVKEYIETPAPVQQPNGAQGPSEDLLIDPNANPLSLL